MKTQPHVRLTADQLREYFDLDLMPSHTYLLLLIRSLRRDGHKLVIENVDDFCQEHGLKRRTFYRAKNILISKGMLNEDIKGRVDLWISSSCADNDDPDCATSGTASATSGTASATSGTASATSGTASATSGTASATSGTATPLNPASSKDPSDPSTLSQLYSDPNQLIYIESDEENKTVQTGYERDPEPTPLRQDPGSWRKYLDPERQVLSTPLPTPWRIRDQNQQLKNHPGFVEFLQSQYEGKISMAVGFLNNARKDPDRNEAARELWDHYIKTNSAEAATVAGIDPLDAFPHKSEWLEYIEANGRMQFELNYPGGTKRERMQFTDILIENEKRAKQEQE